MRIQLVFRRRKYLQQNNPSNLAEDTAPACKHTAQNAWELRDAPLLSSGQASPGRRTNSCADQLPVAINSSPTLGSRFVNHYFII